MEIEQHIQNLKDYIRIDKDNIAYDDSDFAQFCNGHCEDIQAVLDELDNRISRKDIEEQIKQLDLIDEYNAPNGWEPEREYARDILKNLLNKE